MAGLAEHLVRAGRAECAARRVRGRRRGRSGRRAAQRPAAPIVLFAAPWREIGAVLTLGALFVAALPFVTAEDFAWTPLVAAVLVAAGLLAAVAGVPGPRPVAARAPPGSRANRRRGRR